MTQLKLSVSSLHQRFASFIESRRLRKTPERFAILEKAASLEAHFDIDVLYQAMESDGYHVSRATVYNTVELLCACGILRQIHLGGTSARFEFDRGSHFHLVCTNCGKVREIDDSGIISRIASQNSPAFQQTYYSVCVYGLCPKCARKQKKTAAGDHRRTTARRPAEEKSPTEAKARGTVSKKITQPKQKQS